MMPPVKEPLAGLALLVIFGLLIWYNHQPNESSRPFYPDVQYQNPNTTGYAYESRLWEDPFAFDPPEPKEEKSKGYCEKQLIEEIKAAENPVKILAPLLKVRPDTLENRELRTRHRYAVIAGLIESGYRPLKPGYRPLAPGHRPLEAGHLHFCSSQENSGKQEYDVRWEHYSRESQDQLALGKSDIIVVWMNSEIFIDNNRFRVMSKHLLGAKEITKDSFYIYDLSNILDQERSVWITEKINRINDENCKNKGIELGGIQTGDKVLTQKLAKELELRNIKEPSEEVMIITEYDSENARNLSRSFSESLHELFCKRQPAQSSTEVQSTSTENNSESSTCEIKNVFYLKGLDAYQQRIQKHNKSENQAVDKQADRRPAINLHNSPPLPIGLSQLDYFHRLAGQIKAPHHDIDLKKRDSGIKAVGIFGSNFHDKLLMLEALRNEMPNILVFTTDLDAQMLHPQHWRSTRNLVVASHFNLLLKEKEKDDKEQDPKQSYQKHFPGFRDNQQTNIFFSTISIVTGDIENSQNTSPQIFEVGRNGFVRLPQKKEDLHEDLNYHPFDNTVEQTTRRLSLLAGIIISLILFHWAIRPNSGKLTRTLLLGTIAIFFTAWFFATDGLGEPVSFSDGISLWPPIYIQFIAFLMAFAFYRKAREELDENFCCLSRKNFPIGLNREYFPNCLKECGWEECGWELSKQSSRSNFPVVILILTIIVYVLNDMFPSYQYFQFWPCLVFLIVLAIFYWTVTKFETEKDEFDFTSIKDWREKDNCQPEKTNPDTNSCRRSSILQRWREKRTALQKLLRIFRSDKLPKLNWENYEDYLWRQYYHCGLIDHRIIRVVAIWLFFAIIETILIYLLPLWPLPCRGSAACWWASFTGVMGFIVVMLLLFFTLDAVRLSFYWIQKLRTQHPLLTDKITPKHFDDFYNATRNNPLESLEKIVAMVAERTRVVDKLIYYPMLCIMLMLFAKITYFDNQDFPFSKGITFAASISLLFSSGFVLRHEANRLKLSVIKSAENLGKNNICAKSEVNRAIKRISNICEGVFQPMLEQPVMQALLMILASIGLFAGEYLKLLG